MNDEKRNAAPGGLGLSSVLGIVFIVLKLCGVIKWSWLWVLSPFWIVFAIFIVSILIFVFLYGISALFDRRL